MPESQMSPLYSSQFCREKLASKAPAASFYYAVSSPRGFCTSTTPYLQFCTLCIAPAWYLCAEGSW